MTSVPFILYVILIVIYPTVNIYNMYTSAYLSGSTQGNKAVKRNICAICHVGHMYAFTHESKGAFFFPGQRWSQANIEWTDYCLGRMQRDVSYTSTFIVDVMSFDKCLCWTNSYRRTHTRMHTRTRTHAPYKYIVMISDVIVFVSICACELRCPKTRGLFT